MARWMEFIVAATAGLQTRTPFKLEFKRWTVLNGQTYDHVHGHAHVRDCIM
jgi:hypothetical protein